MQNLQQFLMYALGGVVFLLMITVLVAVHELGHYWVARLCGMKVNAFAIMMGGRRVTDLAPRLKRPLASAKTVWLAAALGLLLVLVGGYGNIGWLYTAGLAALGVVIPTWVATRLGALYHLEFGATAKILGLSWLAGLVVLVLAVGGGPAAIGRIFQVVGKMEPNQVLLVLGYASAVALLILYYQPVAKKGEDEDMGAGVLPIDGEQIHVQFRPLLAHKAKSGTEFSLLMIPLGGFAAISGMAPKDDGSETKIEGGFYSKTPLKRLATLFAGPLFSVLFGVLIFVALFTTVGRGEPDLAPVIGSVGDKSVAQRAGLKEGDRIVSVNGVKVKDFYHMLTIVRDRALEPTEFVYERDGKRTIVTMKPDRTSVKEEVLGPDLKPVEGDKRYQGKIGISPRIKMVRLTLNAAWMEAWSAPVEMVKSLGAVAKQPSKAKEQFGGPGTIAVVAVEATSKGIGMILLLAAGLSISLGVMNLLPIPPLDGGQMIVAFVELLRGGRRLSIQVQQMIMSGGLILVIMLVFSVLALDVNRFVTPQEKRTTDQPLPETQQAAPAKGAETP